MINELLNHLHRGGTWGYWWTNPGKTSHWWPTDDRLPIPEGTHNVYFGVHPAGERRSKDQRARTEDIVAISCLFADFDAKDYHDDKAAAAAHVDTLNPSPSVVVDSGGGYHCYWLLAESFTLVTDSKRERARKIQARWVAWVGGDPGAKDLARVLRVPGTQNLKYSDEPTVTVIQADFSRLYALDDLEALLPAEERETHQETREGDKSNERTPWAEAALAEEIAKLARRRDGERNDKLYEAARKLGQIVGAGLLDRSDVERALYATALGIGLEESETLATIQSGVTAGMRKPRGPKEMNARKRQEAMTAVEPATGREAEHPGIADFFRGKTFIPALFGTYLEGQRPFRNIAKSRGDGNLHSYAAGVFERDGAKVVDELAREVLGRAYRSNRVSETAAWLQAKYTNPDSVNQHPGLINAGNGMLNWRTGELRPHDPAYLSTIQIPVKFDPAATCPAIDDFLLTTLPADCIDLALEWFGYCLLPTAKYCKAIMCVGPAANGKSTFLGLLGAFLGRDSTANIPLHELDEHRFKRAMLQDKLANLFADLDQRALKRSGYFKLIVSGDPIDAERKHQHPFTFNPFCKLIFSANKMPTSYDKSPAFYRRWLIIPFPNTFEGAAADPDMPAKITTDAELSGLLNRAIAGLQVLEERRGFAEPQTIAQAMETYKLTSDGMVAFLSECCRDAKQGEWVRKKGLFDAYVLWGEEAKITYTETRAEFNRRLKEIYPSIQDRRKRIEDGKQPRCWYNGPVLTEPGGEQSALDL